MKALAGLLFALFVVLSPALVLAVEPSEMLTDPALEARARAISAGLRCLVCQNESIEDSNADLAHDLRVLVRERIKAGDTDQAATQYIVDRYGEFVLLRPVLAPHTLVLWFAAPAIALTGLGSLLAMARRKRSAIATALTPEEAAALKMLGESDAGATGDSTT